MRTLIMLSTAVLLMLPLFFSPPPAHAVQTLFYDSFTSSYLSTSWSNVQNDPLAGLFGTTSVFTNGGGSMTIQSIRGGIGASGGVIANGTTPLLSSNTLDGQLVDVIYSIKPFNLTLTTGTSAFVFAGLSFGLADRITPYSFGPINGPNNGIWWTVTYGTNGKSITASIQAAVQRPASDAVCYGPASAGWCSTNYGTIMYGPVMPPVLLSTPIDLTQPHIFQMVIHYLNVAGRTWAAFSVDSGVVLNVTQAACSCMGGTWKPLYPFVYQTYAWSTPPPSSQGATVAYILATDYIAPNPTLGFFPSPNPCTGAGGAIPTPINPNGCHGQPDASTDLGTAFQQFAVIAGGGNVYFGGAFITLLVLAVFSIPIALFLTRNVFIHSFITIFVVTIMTMVSILPIYVIVVDIVLGAAIIFKVVSGRGGGEGAVAMSSG